MRSKKGLIILVVPFMLVLWGCGTEEPEIETAFTEEPVEFELPPIVAQGPREPTGLRLEKAGWTYACMECHSAIEAKWHYERPMVEHGHIELNHGTNSFCLNCHHPENRDAYVHYDGSEIDASAVEMLCRKCHGPQYRDWDKGIHGRTNGFWKAEMGEQLRLKCVQCHDPHDPKFKAMEPMSPPTYPARAAGERIVHPDKEKEPHHG